MYVERVCGNIFDKSDIIIFIFYYTILYYSFGRLPCCDVGKLDLIIQIIKVFRQLTILRANNLKLDKQLLLFLLSGFYNNINLFHF